MSSEQNPHREGFQYSSFGERIGFYFIAGSYGLLGPWILTVQSLAEGNFKKTAVEGAITAVSSVVLGGTVVEGVNKLHNRMIRNQATNNQNSGL